MSAQREVQASLAAAASTNPQAFRLYRRFADKVWNSADIDARTTEIIATAITHITRCSYCVSYHSLKAEGLGVSTAELVEAGVLMAAMRALSVAPPADLGLPEVPHDPFLELPFNSVVTALAEKTKILTVLSAAFALRHPELLRRAVETARTSGVTAKEFAKAQGIAAALVAGATTRHLGEVSDAHTH